MRIWPFSSPEPIETKAPSGTSVPADWMFEIFGAGNSTQESVQLEISAGRVSSRLKQNLLAGASL